MSQVLITGATGLVGGHLLRMLINTPQVSAIAAPTRRPLTDIVGVYNPHDPQLTDALAQVTDPVDIVFCCLGTTRREAGSKAAFIHADYTLVVDTALTGVDWARSTCWWSAQWEQTRTLRFSTIG